MSSSPVRRGLSRKIRISLAAFGLVSTLALIGFAESKFAVVDMQRAMMETEEGMRMQANIKKVFETKQRQLENKQQELEREKVDIEKQQTVISEDALRRRAEAWQREMVAFQQLSVQFNQELQKKQSEDTNALLSKMLPIVRRLATSQGYDMIVDRSAVAYVRNDLDLTDRVITTFNGGGVEPAPAATPAPGDKKPAAPAAPPAPAAPKK